MNRTGKIFLIGITAALLLTAGCASNGEVNGDNGGNGVYDLSTKNGIESFIDANWQEYGYSERPSKYIALSFDDGPCPPADSGGTAAMLQTLESLKVKATFFVIGRNVRNNKEAAEALFAAGHELGNHSDWYSSLGDSTVEAVSESLDACSAAIREITGENPRIFRAPNLSHGPNLSLVCGEKGMPLIDGSGHYDWDGTGHTPASIRDSVLAGPQDGGIIVLHENNTSKGNTMAALPEIVSALRERGFWIMTVGRLAAVKEKTLVAGKRYGSIN